MTEADWKIILEDFQGHLDRYSSTTKFPCIFCAFQAESSIEILRHLFFDHSFVVSHLSNLSLLDRYLDYWKIHSPPLIDYYLQDRKYLTINHSDESEHSFREILHKSRLDQIMIQHEKERTTVFPEMKCLFCNSTFTGTLHQYLQWLFDIHQFNPGRPSNLVYIGELVEYLRALIDNNQCIFCNQQFASPNHLQNHIRKKQHGKIPNGTKFDRYYMINYLEIDRKWPDFVNEIDDDQFENLEDGILDFDDEKEVNSTQCIICDMVSSDPDEMILHLLKVHNFDFREIKKSIGNNFYRFVKFVNFARSEKNRGVCFVCSENVIGSYSNHIELHENKIPKDVEKIFLDDQYLIPVIEGDTLLTVFENLDDAHIST